MGTFLWSFPGDTIKEFQHRGGYLDGQGNSNGGPSELCKTVKYGKEENRPTSRERKARQLLERIARKKSAAKKSDPGPAKHGLADLGPPKQN